MCTSVPGAGGLLCRERKHSSHGALHRAALQCKWPWSPWQEGYAWKPSSCLLSQAVQEERPSLLDTEEALIEAMQQGPGASAAGPTSRSWHQSFTGNFTQRLQGLQDKVRSQQGTEVVEEPPAQAPAQHTTEVWIQQHLTDLHLSRLHSSWPFAGELSSWPQCCVQAGLACNGAQRYPAVRWTHPKVMHAYYPCIMLKLHESICQLPFLLL